MLPLQFEDRATAFAAAFASRFAIGVLAATTQLPLPAWCRGLVVGLLISIPDAIITQVYAPILVTGVIGGTLIGWAAGNGRVRISSRRGNANHGDARILAPPGGGHGGAAERQPALPARREAEVIFHVRVDESLPPPECRPLQ